MVQQCSGENQDHTKIQPKHQQDIVGQASVESAVCFVVVYIQGVQKGKNDPHKGSEYGTGSSFLNVVFPLRPGTKRYRHRKYRQKITKAVRGRSKVKFFAQNTGKRWELVYDKIYNTVAIDQYQQAADDHD